MSKEKKLSRRMALAGLMVTAGLGGCMSQYARSNGSTKRDELPAPYQESRQRMREKFGRIGAQLVIDAFAGEEFFGVEFFPEGSDRPFYAKSAQSLKTGGVMSMPLEIPERVRVVWREGIAKPFIGKYGQMTYEGAFAGDYTIEVGSRIPQEVIDSIRRDGGGLRLKFRLSNDGVYFGWDIERRPGYDRKKIDPATGFPYSAAPVWFMTGGDFKESQVVYDRVQLKKDKGWYIDKKTGRRIETIY